MPLFLTLLTFPAFRLVVITNELENKENIEMHIIVNDFVNHKSYQKQKLIEANENYNLKDLKFYTKIENKYLNIDYVNESKLNKEASFHAPAVSIALLLQRLK